MRFAFRLPRLRCGVSTILLALSRPLPPPRALRPMPRAPTASKSRRALITRPAGFTGSSWEMAITISGQLPQVEVLDLRTFAGGLRPLKLGGGLQTKSLRLVNPEVSVRLPVR
jgi:hypothetical protein